MAGGGTLRDNNGTEELAAAVGAGVSTYYVNLVTIVLDGDFLSGAHLLTADVNFTTYRAFLGVYLNFTADNGKLHRCNYELIAAVGGVDIIGAVPYLFTILTVVEFVGDFEGMGGAEVAFGVNRGYPHAFVGGKLDFDVVTHAGFGTGKVDV